MPQLNNIVDVLKILPKTNCRDCKQPTCMAFAAAVLQGRAVLADCPHLSAETLADCRPPEAQENKIAQNLRGIIAELEKKVSQVDLAVAVNRTGGRLIGDRLAVKMLGKDFVVDPSGEVVSQCHTNMWLRYPLLNYVLLSQGREPTGKWTPFRELTGARSRALFFEHRCEAPLKKLIEGHTDLFELLFDMFMAQPAEAFDSDIACVIHPLPKVPLLICYWKPEGGMGSDLSLFWDAGATDNVNVDSLYYLGAGMETMFEKITRTHG